MLYVPLEFDYNWKWGENSRYKEIRMKKQCGMRVCGLTLVATLLVSFFPVQALAEREPSSSVQADYQAEEILWEKEQEPNAGESSQITSEGNPAAAEESVVLLSEDQTGDFTYTLTDGVAILTKYTGTGGTVVVPETLGDCPVTAIGSYAFENCDTLVSVSIPESVTEIGWYAFYKCGQLARVDLPDGVTVIGTGAFRDCGSLAGFTLPSALESLESQVFQDCGSLTSIQLPAGLKSMGDKVFTGTALTQLTLPSGLTQVGSSVLNGCTGVTQLAIPRSLTEFSNGEGFLYGSSVCEVVFEAGTEKIPDNACKGAASLTSVSIPESVTEIGWYAFYQCGQLARVDLPDGVTAIGTVAFRDCGSLAGITLPSALESLGSEVFRDCGSLTSIQLPDDLKSMGDQVFAGTALTQLTLPAGLTQVGSGVLSGCSGVTQLTIPKSLTKFSNGEGFLYGSSVSEIVFETGTEKIPDNACKGAASLTSVSIPESVTEIGWSAFYQCGQLARVDLPDGVTAIGTGAFRDCGSLVGVTLPSALESLGSEVFRNCHSLIGMVLPAGLTQVGDNVFYGCTGITALTIPKMLTNFDNGSGFLAGSSVRSVIFEDGILKIPDYACMYATSLVSVKIPSSVTSVGWYAFYGCTQLAQIELPNGITDIQTGAFGECDQLTSVILPGQLSSMGTYIFRGCGGLKDLTIPGYVESVAEDAFVEWEGGAILAAPSETMVRALIKQGIGFQPLGDFTPNTAAGLSSAGCGINVSGGSLAAGGQVVLTVRYQVEDSVFKQWHEPAVRIYLAGEAVPSGDALTVDGVATSHYTYSAYNKTVTIPISQSSGTIRLAVSSGGESVLCYAELFIDTYGVGPYLLGFVSRDQPILSLEAVSATNQETVEVSGVAPAGQMVTLSVDGVPCATVTALKNGHYSGSVSLDSPVDGRRYCLEASAVADGKTVTARTDVVYEAGFPTVTRFTLLYGGKVVDLTDNSKSVALRFDSNNKPSFQIVFDYPEQVGTVLVTGTENGVTKTISAQWDPITGTYLACGWFDEGNHGFFPGNLNVYYSLKGEDTGERFIPPLFEQEQLPEEWKNATVTEKTVDGDHITAEITLGDEAGSQWSYESQTLTLEEAWALYLQEEVSLQSEGTCTEFFKEIRKKIKENVVKNSGEAALLNDPEKKTLTYLVWDPLVSAVRSTSIQYGGAWGIQDFYYNQTGLNMSFPKASNMWTIGYGMGTALYDFVTHVVPDIQAAEAEIRASTSLTAEQKQAALKEMEEVRGMYAGLYILRLLSTVMQVGINAAYGPVAGALYGLLAGALIELVDNYLEDSLAYYRGCAGGVIVWAIDPSGYVYEAVPGNRLEGVTATVYGVEYDGSEEFWDTPPTALPTQSWEAGEWEQENPLITDQEGRYAWDVPRGWWCVTYEKEGYETACSQWLPVPPPQTQVNIPMVSVAAPQVAWVQVYSEYAQIEFTKYMEPEGVQAGLTLTGPAGEAIPFTLEYIGELGADGVSEYARNYVLRYDVPLTPGILCTLKLGQQACSYAGTAIAPWQQTAPVREQPPTLSIAQAAAVSYQDQTTLVVETTGLEPGAAVSAVSHFAQVADISPTATVDQEGRASFVLTGHMVGEDLLTLWVPDTGVTLTVPVVVKPGDSLPALRIISGQQAESTLQAVLSNTTAQTADGVLLCALYDSGGRMLTVRQTLVTVEADGGRQMVSLDFAGTEPWAEYRWFFLSDGIWAPLCTSLKQAT